MPLPFFLGESSVSQKKLIQWGITGKNREKLKDKYVYKSFPIVYFVGHIVTLGWGKA